MKKINQKGFTLIELLVVIAIIGILSTLSVVALGNARQKARDAKRVADVKQIQTALELYYNSNNTYPATLTLSGAISDTSTTYMANVPTNPLPVTDGTCLATSTYSYTRITANNYSIEYCLGGETGGITAGVHHATPAGIGN